jgi:hypothetical protein
MQQIIVVEGSSWAQRICTALHLLSAPAAMSSSTWFSGISSSLPPLTIPDHQYLNPHSYGPPSQSASPTENMLHMHTNPSPTSPLPSPLGSLLPSLPPESWPLGHLSPFSSTSPALQSSPTEFESQQIISRATLHDLQRSSNRAAQELVSSMQQLQQALQYSNNQAQMAQQSAHQWQYVVIVTAVMSQS